MNGATWSAIRKISDLMAIVAGPSTTGAQQFWLYRRWQQRHNGSFPQTGVIADAAGNLYGTTFFGGASGDGTVFKLDINTDTLSTLAVFDGTNGASPLAGLFADSAGNLFGTTSGGGASDDGTVFEITGSGFVVPEPSGFVLMVLPAVAVLHRRRKPISS
jgi:uncharacterized repeat protein (TIGR03803 family)